MEKIKIFIEIQLKRMKNRMLIILAENIYILLIIAILAVTVIGGCCYFADLFTNLPYKSSFADKLYYSVIFMSQISFVFVVLREDIKEEENFLWVQLFDEYTLRRAKFIICKMVALCISSIIILFMVTRFNNIKRTMTFGMLLLVLLCCQMSAETISFIVNRTLKRFLYRYSFIHVKKYLYVISIFIFTIIFSTIFKNNIWENQLNGLFIGVALGIIFISYVYILLIKFKNELNDIHNMNDTQKCRINFDEPFVLVSRAIIGSKKYITLCIGMTLLVQLFGKIFHDPLVVLFTIKGLLNLGVIVFIIERFHYKDIKVLKNLNVSIWSYSIAIEHIYYLITLVVFFANIFLTSFILQQDFFSLLYQIGIIDCIFVYYITVICVGNLRFILGNEINNFLFLVLIMLSFLISNVVLPYIISLYDAFIGMIISIVILHILQLFELRSFASD